MTRSHSILAAAILGTALAGGCRSPEPAWMAGRIPVAVIDKPSELQAGYRALNAEGARNYVLNEMEIGIDAYQRGYRALAKTALDGALDGVEAVFGDDANARKARQLWYSEGCKTFKGEPYERAMAYYYRGLLYIDDGDLENARACFRAGLFQDAFAEEEQYRSDFALLLYLDVWCSLMLDERTRAADDLKFLARLRPDCAMPTADDTLLVIGETGVAPQKLAEGRDGSLLCYSRGYGFREGGAKVTVEHGTETTLYPIEDIYFQASTRGGRPVDYLLNRKAVFKDNWDAAGTVMTHAGMAGMGAGSQMRGRDRDVAMAVSGGVTLLGMLAQITAAHVEPRADTRQVRNLPDTVHVTAMPRPLGARTVTYTFVDPSGAVVSTVVRNLPDARPNRGGTLVWARSAPHLVSGRQAYGPEQWRRRAVAR